MQVYSRNISRKGERLLVIVVREKLVFIGIGRSAKINLVVQNSTNPAEALDELYSLWRMIRYYLKSGSEVFVMFSYPIDEQLLFSRSSQLQPDRRLA